MGEAELAYRNSIRMLGENPVRLAGLGETLVAVNEGVVTEEARQFFEKAVAADHNNMRARFYVALGLEQSGRQADARIAFETLAKDSPPGAAWADLVHQHIVKNTPGAQPPAPGNPSAEDVAAAETMAPAERQAMVRGMVDSLAAKLSEDPRNIEGWLRLVRSYKVLGDDAKATEALRAGLKTFPAQESDGQRLVALARQIGLAVEEARP
jgi:cytochrome c-type biogenesis protein CcmH